MYWQSLVAGWIAGFGFNSFDVSHACLQWYAPILTLIGFCVLGHIVKIGCAPRHNKTNTLRFAEDEKASFISKKSLFSAYCFGFAYHTTSLFWVGNAFDYTSVPFVKYFTSCVLAFFLAIQFPLSMWLATRYTKGSFALKWVSIFAAFDALRTCSPLLFPWNPMGFISGEFCLSSIRWWGILGLSWLMLLFSQILQVSRRWQFFLITLLGLLCIDHYLYQKKPTVFTSIYGRIVQPCISQNFKWQREKVAENIEAFRSLSNEPVVKKLDFILWPESALPAYFTKDVNELAFLAPKDVPLIAGHVHVMDKNHIYTSLSCIDRQKGIRSTYQKRYLVPFGEYIPIPFIDRIIPFITEQKMDTIAGPKKQILDLSTVGLPNAHTLICYESIFPQTIFNYQKWIIGVSNDAWFGLSSGPYQHLRWNQIRCLENNIPMIRSTNHGISAVINSQGKLIKWLGLNECGVIDCHAPASSGPSFYNTLHAIPR